MCDTPVTFLVDTGANITIMRSGVYKSIPESRRPQLRPVVDIMVLADGESSLPFDGCARFKVVLDGHTVEHTVWVADIGADAILGLEFMRSHNYHLDIRNGVLSWERPVKSTEINTVLENSGCHDLVEETVVIAPGSEAIV